MLANFDVNQFTSIGWFNVAYGLTLIALQLVMFHGESKCTWRSQKPVKSRTWHVLRLGPGAVAMEIFISFINSSCSDKAILI